MQKVADIALGLFLGLATGAISVAALGSVLFGLSTVTSVETSLHTTTLMGPTATVTETVKETRTTATGVRKISAPSKG